MNTAKEYFEDLFSRYPSVVAVYAEGDTPIVVTGQESVSPGLFKKISFCLSEAKECCRTERKCVSVSCKQSLLKTQLSFVPYPFQDKIYAVGFLQGYCSSVADPEKLRNFVQNTTGILNEQLNNIYGVAELQGLESSHYKRSGRSVRQILRMAHRFRQIMGEELAFYTVRANLSSFALACTRAVQHFMPEAPLTVEKNSEVLLAELMPEDAEQVFYTLLSNALRFCKSQVTVRTEQDEESVCIVVEDDGNGAVDPNRIFELGNSTPDRYGKVGLGCSLALAKQLMERQNGRVEYHRTNGKTCFKMVFPAIHEVRKGRLAEWKTEPAEDLLSQVRVEMSDVYDGSSNENTIQTEE